jgi:PAS domain S-box-containing protein
LHSLFCGSGAKKEIPLGLRRKTQLITGLVLLGLLAALYAITRRTLMVQFAQLEEEQTRQNLDRVSNAINNELDLLNGSARDDSMWDEAYAFVQNPRPEWGEQNFAEDTYTHLRLNALAYFNTEAEAVFAREYDSVTHRQEPARAEIVESLTPLARSLQASGATEGQSGILDLPQGPLLVAVWPVVTSVGKVSPKGVLIMGRWLNQSELRRLGWTLNLQFDVFPMGSLRSNSQAYAALTHLSEGRTSYVTPLSEEQIAGFSLLKGIGGAPAMVLQVTTPRKVHLQGQTALKFLMLATLLIGLVFTLVNALLLDRLILERLLALRDSVATIGNSNDLSRRVPAEGADELAQLGSSMNRMLAAFEHSRKNLNTQAQAMEVSADGIGILNERGEYVYVNQAHARIAGYSRGQDLIGKSWKVLYNTEEARRLEKDVMPLLALEGRWEGEAIAIRNDGTSFPQQVSLAMLAEGGMVCICRDLSERRRMEEQLRKKQRMESIGTLAGGIAHDFNNMLTVILGYGQTLLTKVESDPSWRTPVEHIVKSASRATTLTRQLLAFSRKQILQPRVLDLNAVVRDLEKMLRPLVGDDVVMVTGCAPGLASVKADLSQIEQVIVNLVVNARDALPKGGRVIVTTANMDRDHESGRDREIPAGRYVVLSVVDNGVGMSPEVLSRIFEPFYTTKEVGKGTGLGLSMVYGIVEQSGGFITVKSRPGEGTEFRIFLPRVEAAPESIPPDRKPAWKKNGTETVLLVEDDPAVRELAHDILHSCGYRVIVVASPSQLHSVLQRLAGPIHILVTDVLMPDLNGREVADEVQRRHPDVKTLFMSGYAYQTMLGRGVLEPGCWFLQKPFTPSQLSEMVRDVLDQVQVRSTAAR